MYIYFAPSEAYYRCGNLRVGILKFHFFHNFAFIVIIFWLEKQMILSSNLGLTVIPEIGYLRLSSHDMTEI